MASLFQKFDIPFISLGIGLSRNDLLLPLGIMENIRNCDIHQLGLGKRGGSSLEDNMTGNPRVTGLKQFVSKQGDRHILRGTGDGKFWKDNTNTIKTGLSIRGDEILAEGDVNTHEKWDVTLDFDDSGGNLSYTHSAGAGTAKQLNINLLKPLKPGKLYEFSYTVSGVTDTPDCFIISTTGETLTLVNGAQTTQFTSISSPTGFELQVPSSGGTDAFVLDDLSLKEVIAPPVDISIYLQKAIFTNGRDVPQVFTGLRFLEIPGALVAGNAEEGAGNLDNGKYTYKVTFVNANGETSGGLVSNEIDIADNTLDGQASLTNIPIGPNEVTARKIYRTEGGGSTFKLLVTIEDNDTTTFIDNVGDGNLGSTLPTDNTATTGTSTTDLGGEGLTRPGALVAALSAPSAPTAKLNGAGSVDSGTHSYVVVFIDADGVHTAKGSKSNIITAAGGGSTVDLTNIAIGPPGTVQREIFRTKTGDAGQYYELAEIDDNTTTIYSDNIADSALGSEVLTNGALTGGTNWTTTGDFAIVGGQAVFTDATGNGTLKQSIGDYNNVIEGDHLYEFTYEVVSITGALAAFALTALSPGATQVDLNQSVGTHTVLFTSAATPGSFSLAVVSTGNDITVDNLSLLEVAKTGDNITVGTHNYKVTFVNAHGETVGGESSNTITADAFNGEINLSSIPTGPLGVTSRNIYRTFGGFESPETALTAALAGLGAGNLDEDVYSYKATFVNANGETLGSPISNQITPTSGNGQASLTAIPIGPSGTTSRKIYRTEGGGSVYKLLTTIADNTTTTFTDNVADGSLGAEIPATVHSFLATIPDNTTTTYTDMIVDGNLGDAIPTTNTAANRPNDWIGTNQPKWALEHTSGNTEGIIFGGLEDNKNDLYVVVDGTEDVSQANIIFFNINTGDDSESGLVGGVEFGNRPFVFSKNNAWFIDKSSVNVSDWNYFKAPWRGGTINNRTLVKVLNDVYSMAPDGNIYKLSTVQAFGDYKTASITRANPKRLQDFNRWIQINVDFDFAEDFHGEYVPEIRAVRFWVVRQGETEIDTALTYYIDHDRWSVHDNRDFNSGFSASVSTTVRESDGTEVTYTGDYGGNVWKLDQTARNDNSNGYWAGFKTNGMTLPLNNLTDDRVYNKFIGIYEEIASQDFEVNAWVDGSAIGAGQIDMTSNYNDFKVDRHGKSLQIEMYNNTANEDFFIMGLEVFSKLLNQ